MAKFRVTAPDGGVYEVNAPDGATEQDAIAWVQQNVKQQDTRAQKADRYGLTTERTGGLEGQISGKGQSQLAGRSLAAGRALNALQGASFNFADEILPYTNAALDQAYGAVTGDNPGNFDESVNFYRGQAREIGDRMWQERPGETLGTQIAGGLATGGPIVKGATSLIGVAAPGTAAALRAGAASLPARIVQGGVAGAIGGGLAGAGSGEGLEDRAGRALVGGVVGAPVGAAIPALTSSAGAAGRYLQSTFLPGTVDAERRAAGVLGQAVNRSILQGNQSPSQALQGMQGGGINNAAIADLSDELTAMTGAVARSPGKGRQIVGDFLRARQEGDPSLAQAGGGQWADIFDDISSKISPSVSAKRAAEAVVKARANKATPLYDKFRQLGPLQSPDLAELAQIPTMRGALQRGIRMAQQERTLPANYKLNPDDALPGQVWHQAKMAIDGMIGTAVRAGNKTQARSLEIMQQQLLNALDTASNGVYGQARNTFAGDSALLNALESGKDILQKSVSGEDIADQLARLTSQSEKDFFRAGAAQALRDTVSRVGRKGNAAATFLNRPDMQQKLQALLNGPGEYQDFIGRLMGRDRLYRTYLELGNSQTQPRIAAEADLEASIRNGPEPESFLSAAASRGRSGIVQAAMQRLNDGSVRFLSEKVRTKLAEMLTSSKPDEVQRAAQMIQMAARMNASAQLRGNAMRIGGVQGGILQPITSGMTSPPQE